ncbi:MAG: hypothetical protein DMF63_09305 [Acidobacteria bacterium]|nr:MAG: hypothetical protein DMF63_09305 [Acidobacteriota bacterium]
MNQRTKTGLEILQAAALIGILGNLLLRHTPWGLNAFLFVATFVAGLIMLMWRRRPELLTANTIALAGAMTFFASMFLLRDSIELRVYDTIAILVIMGVILLVNFGVKAHVAGTFHYAAGFVWSGLTSAFGPFVLLGSDIDWKAMPGNKISKSVFAVLRGLAIALPLLLIFGALFMAADAAFEGYVNRALNFDIDIIVSHVMVTSALAWLTAGYFRGAIAEKFVPVAAATASTAATHSSDKSTSFVEKVAAEPADNSSSLPDNATILEHINRSDPPNKPEAEPAKKRDWQTFDSSILPSVFTLGTVETVIILGLIDLLFLGFVIIQVPYLFGGMEYIQQAPDFKLADYARRGFGELVAVSALVLPMLLASHWLLRREAAAKTETIFKVLAGVQIALLFVIMASVVQRLVLLTGELGYGMTTIRFYPMVFMIWLAVVFGWFALTVFRGARNHFAWGALWSALVILGATNLLNPDAFIVQTNVRLMHQGRQFDALYNSNLSDDAIRVLFDALPSMNSDDQCVVAYRLYRRMVQAREEGDLRSWNASRSVARSMMAEHVPPSSEESMSGCLLDATKPLPF